MITIIENGKINDFFKVGEIVYPKSSSYVSIFKDDLKRFLDKSNPLFKTYGKGSYFIAYRDGIPVGRIVAHIHYPSNEKFNIKRGYFGYFDCVDDVVVSKALLDHVMQYHKSEGMNEIAGNFNLTAMQQMGVMTSGFENHHYTDQVYGAAHIPTLLEKYGFKSSFPMTTFEINLNDFDPSKLLKKKVSDLFDDSNYKFLEIKKKHFNEHMLAVKEVLNDGFADNPMFVPLTDEEFMFQAKDMMWIIDEKISSLVEYKGKPIGTVVCIPDLNGFLKNTNSKLSFKTPLAFLKHKFNRDRAVIIFYSVCQEHHGKGVNPAMLYKVTTALKERGYKSLGLTWIADENVASLKQTEKLGAKKLHGLNLYKMDISND